MKRHWLQFVLLLCVCLGASGGLMANASPQHPAPHPAQSVGQTAAPTHGSPASVAVSDSLDRQNTYTLSQDREPMTALLGQWRFQPGDDPRWSASGFDDSRWALVGAGSDWDEIGYHRLDGVAWYRFHLVVPAGGEPYSLYLPTIYTSYQLFLNGRLLLTQGGLPPHASNFRGRPTVLDLPLPQERANPETVTLALRIWHDPQRSQFRHGGLQGVALVGRSDLIHDRFDREEQGHLWQRSDDLDLGALELLGAVVALALFLTRRSEREFLWFGLLVFCQGTTHFLTAWDHLHAHPPLPLDLFLALLSSGALAAGLLFFRVLFRGRWSNSFVFALACCGLDAIVFPLGMLGALSIPQQNLFGLVLSLPVYGWIILFVRQQSKRKQQDARVLRGPNTFLYLTATYSALLWTLQTFGLGWLENFHVRWRNPFYLTLDDLAEVIFLAAMLIVLLRRFALRSLEQDRVHSEIEAARSVQQVLVPKSLPQLPGLLVSTAYHPAQELGGDFFQIVPLPLGEVLFVIGDVAGKGLPAALQVSLVVGTLRTLVAYTSSPAEILVGLNRALQGRGPGFTTCLALCLAADRCALTFANAGHIAPYVNGFELRTEPNLPLGLVPEVAYDEVPYVLNAGDHLTILTDGVPEAMHHRELFGFERTGQLSRQTASEIAEAARRFGQTDDITVLTVDVVSQTTPTLENLAPPSPLPA